MNGVVYTASPAAQGHFPSGLLEMKIGPALRTMDVCLCHGAFGFTTPPQPFSSREGRGAGTQVFSVTLGASEMPDFEKV
jgi:hypothetical protein